MTDYQQCVVRNGEQSGVIAKTPFFIVRSSVHSDSRFFLRFLRCHIEAK